MSPRPSISDIECFSGSGTTYNCNMPNPEDFLNVDITHIKNQDKICWEYTHEPDSDEDWEEVNETGLWCRPAPRTFAISTAAELVHLSKLQPSTLFEWYYRLNALFDANEYFLFTESDEGPIPIRITLHDLKDHLGMRIDTKDWSNSKFDSLVRSLRMRTHLREFIE